MGCYLFGKTSLKINMEPENDGLLQMIFLFKQVIFRWATKKTFLLSIILVG